MATYGNPAFLSDRRGVTLKTLKQQRCSLNMRILLAMQNHDMETLAELEKQIKELDRRIDSLKLGGGL